LFSSIFSDEQCSSSAQAEDVPKSVNNVKNSFVQVAILDNLSWLKPKKNYKIVGGGVAVKHNIVVTRCSILAPGKQIMVIQGDFYSLAKIIAANKSQDICLLKVRSMLFSFVNVRPSNNLRFRNFKIPEHTFSLIMSNIFFQYSCITLHSFQRITVQSKKNSLILLIFRFQIHLS